MTGVEGPEAGSEAVVGRILRPRSLTTIVADRIRDLIITDKLRLGEQLSENALAEQLGVSRTPVREAFLRLETERLVEVRPQRGTFVFRYDATELREICELREVLETGALRVGLARDRAGLIEALRATVEAAQAAVALGPAAYQAFDTAFHETLLAASSNRELIGAYGRISGRVRAIRFRLTTSVRQIGASQRHHRRILDEMQAGADANAEALLARHVYRSYRFFLDRSRQRILIGADRASATREMAS
ncbi:MAG: GntR family transcriptional regulator [Methylobacteriaceae bacterium]|nr:GntR family transcriptional regulator [Methylobacteriaceae bacterium]MBV9247165.1 GntR family transcriptional regulator [Methylobacteriaceae bacterium]MBV9637716.1 GntR family transcriptional regulator [Methylobacteriaceae bacterium]MBV9704036.1 GntR family transcriptional regulator [Methylobacteriaceae bacterium]